MSINIPICLTIAGSDSGGGAGIQADLKTFSSLKTFGTSVITAITAQNSHEVIGIEEISTDFIYKQIQAVATDFPIRAFKSGMLSSRNIIEIVESGIREFKLQNYVLDPVMVAKSGAKLLKEDAIDSMVSKLFPLAHVVTPNLPEAEVLIGEKIESEAAMRKAAEKILNMGPSWVIIKGGHGEGNPVDWVFSKESFFALPGKRVHTQNTHGSGCSYSSAITAFLARGFTTEEAIREAKKFIHKAIIMSLKIGQGHGPLHHFHPWYNFEIK